jgi:hypothetical protein
MRGRVWFADNPWPAGHAIVEFGWTGRIDGDGRLWFDLRLRTEDYDVVEASAAGAGDWGSPVVWRNYHRATIEPYRMDSLRADPFRLTAPHTLTADPVPVEEPAFAIYLLGHDSVADHTLTFTPTPRGHTVVWTGAIALTYAGEEEYRHRFRAELHALALPTITVPPDGDPHAWLARVVDAPSRYVLDGRVFRPV